jgi:ADP-heptose:LPS heptosyltransferase
LPVRDTVVIHPGASAAYKRWPAENFRDLAARLATHSPVAWIETPETPAVGLSDAVQRIRTNNLRELTGWLDRARLFVGNNSGPLHLASALGTPSLILNGPTDPAWDPIWHRDRIAMLRDASVPCISCDVWADYPGHCVNRQTPMACMQVWTVERVMKAALDQLQATASLSG